MIAETFIHSPGCDMQGRAGIGRGAQRNGADVSQQLSKGKDYRIFFYYKVLALHMKSNRDTGYLVVEAVVVGTTLNCNERIFDVRSEPLSFTLALERTVSG